MSMKGREPMSTDRRTAAVKSPARKSMNEVPPPSRLAGLDPLVRVVRESRPATIYDRAE